MQLNESTFRRLELQADGRTDGQTLGN